METTAKAILHQDLHHTCNSWDMQRDFCITLLQEQVLSAALDKIETKYTRLNQGCISQPHKTRTGEEAESHNSPFPIRTMIIPIQISIALQDNGISIKSLRPPAI